MLHFKEFIESAEHIDASLTLPFDDRQKSRMKVSLDNGQPAGLILPRGRILRNGDLLRADSGEVVQINAANEQVSTVKTDDALLLSRVCYHLGNRHVPLQITAHWCRFQADHILDDMVHTLGAHVTHEQAPFEPESGAYHNSASHGHSHSGSHSHSESEHH